MLQRLWANGANRPSLMRVGAAVSISVVILILIGAPGGLAAVSTLLWMAALVSAATGAIANERVSEDRLTRYDEAAILMLLSVVLGLMVSPVARPALPG